MGRGSGKKRWIDGRFDWQAAERNLVFGVQILLYHPTWNRTCADCVKYQYRQDGTIRREYPGGPLQLRSNPNATPCSICPKIPKDAPAKHRNYAIELSSENERAWEFYQECRAVGNFPEDDTVRWYASLLRQIEDEYARISLRDSIAKAIALMGATRG